MTAKQVEDCLRSAHRRGYDELVFAGFTFDGAAQAAVQENQDDKDSKVRMHLAHIAKAFAEGDFDIPLFVHDQTPPGVPVMKRLAKEIHFNSHDTERGGEVTITSTSPEAIRAIHDFLVFQIREHKTGDPTALR